MQSNSVIVCELMLHALHTWVKTENCIASKQKLWIIISKTSFIVLEASDSYFKADSGCSQLLQ